MHNLKIIRPESKFLVFGPKITLHRYKLKENMFFTEWLEVHFVEIAHSTGFGEEFSIEIDNVKVEETGAQSL